MAYNITIGTLANGSVTADKATAAEGDTVTLTVTPEAGYRLADGSLKVSYGNGAAVSVSGGENTYTFLMPTANVTVTAEFEPVPASPGGDGTLRPKGQATRAEAAVMLTSFLSRPEEK